MMQNTAFSVSSVVCFYGAVSMSDNNNRTVGTRHELKRNWIESDSEGMKAQTGWPRAWKDENPAGHLGA
jgi:hypothetical protein